MLNFTTTTIINDITNVICADDSKIYNASNTNSPIGDNPGDGKFIRVNFGPKLFNDGTIHKAVLVGKQPYVAAVPAEAEVEIPSASGIYRIAMYIRLRNNNNPYFYNNWTFKGRPLYIEFNGGDSVTNIINRAKKFMLAEYGYNLVKFSEAATTYSAVTSGNPESGVTYYSDNQGQNTISSSTTFYQRGTAVAYASLDLSQPVYDAATSGTQITFYKASNPALVITAVDQWEIFMDQDSNDGVKIEKLEVVDTAGQPASASTTLPTHEEFLPYASAVVTVNNGNEAFGDFAHIVKDLRLPTAANRRWQGIAEGDVFGGEPNDDKPMPNGHYTQYTIQYTSERGVLQQTAVGGLGVSRTVHVFYVEDGGPGANTIAFEAALIKAGIATNAQTGGLV